jgi:hypothetical protein
MSEVFTSDSLREHFAAGADLVMHEYAPAVQRERLIAVYKGALKPNREPGRLREVEREPAA